MTHHEINELTKYKVDVKRLKKLKRKQEAKSKTQRLRGFFWLLVVVGFICQVLSALLASTGILYFLSQRLNSAGIIVGILAFILLIGLEVAKRYTLTSFHAQRLDDEAVNPTSYIAMLSLGVFSVFSTYFGTPHAVEFFTTAPNLVNLEQVAAQETQTVANDTTFYAQKYRQAKADRIAFFEGHKKRNNKDSPWRLSSARVVQSTYNILIQQESSAAQKLDQVLAESKQKEQHTLSHHQNRNQMSQAEYEVWCQSFGFILSLVSIALEILLFFSFWWTETYQRLEVEEAATILELAKKEKGGNAASDSPTFNLQDDTTFNPKGKGQEVPKGTATAAKDKGRKIGFEYKGKDASSPTTFNPKGMPNLKVKVVDNQAPLPLGLDQNQKTPLGLKLQKQLLNLKVKHPTFNPKEGTIIKAKGRRKARVIVAVGEELRPMTLGQLNNLIKAQTGAERIHHLETLKSKLA